MAVSISDAQAAYQTARDALDAISRSKRASDDQKQQARDAREELDLNFIGQNIQEVVARTQQFQRFVNLMTDLLDSLTADALLRGTRDLTAVLAAAKSLLDD